MRVSPGNNFLFCGRDRGVCCIGKRTLRPEELARDVEGLASDNDNLLTVQKLLRDGAGETAEQVSLAINDNLVKERSVSPK